MGFRLLGLGFWVRVQAFGFLVQGFGFRVQGFGFWVQGLGFLVNVDLSCVMSLVVGAECGTALSLSSPSGI